MRISDWSSDVCSSDLPGSSLLDVGCGDGTLMAALRDEKGCDARGMEIDPANVGTCVARGLSVIQGNADSDLAFYPDQSVDYARSDERRVGTEWVRTCRSRW